MTINIQKEVKIDIITLIVYIDDIVVIFNHLGMIQRLKDYLYLHFHINDLGDLKCFLGFEVARSKRD